MIELEAKYYVGGDKYDYCYVNQNLPLKQAKQRKMSSVNIKVENLDNCSEKVTTPKLQNEDDNFRNDKRVDFGAFINNETLAPSVQNTKSMPTPTNRNKRKLTRILKKAHRMRFDLIMKLRDGKIFFEIIDEYFNKRAHDNAVKVQMEKHKAQYKINSMYEIFEPKPEDLFIEVGSTTPLIPTDSPTHRSKRR